MNRKIEPTIRVPAFAFAFAFAFVLLASCADPKPFDASKRQPREPVEEEICPAQPGWLPNTAEFEVFKPAPHPEGECPFYSGGWQNFLIATQIDPATGEPAIRSYPTIDDVFKKYMPLPDGALAPPGQPRGTVMRSWLGDIKQAGGRQVLVDQNGHTLYYGIHVNQVFVDFIKDNSLETANAVQNANPNLFFPAGVVEFKSAWQWIDENDASLSADYITTRAWVPSIRVVGTGAERVLVEDRDHPKEIKVRLLALHVVFTYVGHPEFIWATFEHTAVPANMTDTRANDGHRDVAPIFENKNPDPVKDPTNRYVTDVVDPDDHILFKGGTTAQAGNKPITEIELASNFDEASQTFQKPGGEKLQTSIYRMFPASKSNTVEPDAAITSLNHNVEALFRKVAPNDVRGHYRLAGAQWMDKPVFFDTDRSLQNDDTSPLLQGKGAVLADVDPVQAADRDEIMQGGLTGIEDIQEHGADSVFSMLAGEDRLSSTAMESFTQAPDNFDNCFTCHNTKAINTNGVDYEKDPSAVKLMTPKRLNVSHVLSQFVLEECFRPENLKPDAELPPNLRAGDGSTVAVCP